MVDAKVSIGKSVCEACDPDGEPKWGLITQIGENSVFMCEDCVGEIYNKIIQLRMQEDAGVIKVENKQE